MMDLNTDPKKMQKNPGMAGEAMEHVELGFEKLTEAMAGDEVTDREMHSALHVLSGGLAKYHAYCADGDEETKRVVRAIRDTTSDVGYDDMWMERVNRFAPLKRLEY